MEEMWWGFVWIAKWSYVNRILVGHLVRCSFLATLTVLCRTVSSFQYAFPRPQIWVHWNQLPITTRKRSLRRLCFYMCCQSFCSRGGGLPQCMLGYHPPGPGTPLGAGTPPPQQAPPRADTPPPRVDTPWDQAPPRCRPPCTVHAGRYSQQVGGMHPTGMQSCFLTLLMVHMGWKWDIEKVGVYIPHVNGTLYKLKNATPTVKCNWTLVWK